MIYLPEILHVRVTQHHIDSGVPTHSQLCPIALAVKDLWSGGIGFIAVQRDCVRIYHNGNTSMTWEPTRFSRETMRQFVETFDDQLFWVVEPLAPITLALKQVRP